MQQTMHSRTTPYWQAILSVAAHAQQGTPAEAAAALVSLRNLSQCSPADAESLLFCHACDALGFSSAQCVCLACSLAALTPPEQYQTAQQGDVPAAALDFVLGRAPALPAGAWLTQSLQGQVLYHHTELLTECTNYLRAFFLRATASARPFVLGLVGNRGVGRTFFAQTLAETLGYATLCVDVSRTAVDDALLQHLCNVAALYGAVLCYTNWGGKQPALLAQTTAQTRLVFVTATHFVGVAGDFALCTRTLAPLQPAERLCALQGLLPSQLPAKALAQVAQTYRLDMQKILAIACRLQGEALAGTLTAAQLYAAVQAEHSVALSQRATLLCTNKRLADVVLPAAQHAQLTAILACVKNRETVYQDWGFAQTIPYGRGIAALFYGASGTGKTLAASALANELGLALYRVDLSQLTSKYVGETQKNIAQIFDEAEQTDCILFFDEADAIFSRRSDGAEAQDKQINAEVAYLLQRTEAYTGVMLLATNLLHNFDDAFRRRMQYMVHFPLPDATLRTQLWQGIFPATAPTQSIDYPLLAEQLEVSGAGVRNIALAAAYRAAQTETAITTACCVQAARLEYAKQGKAFPRYLEDMYPQERSAR